MTSEKHQTFEYLNDVSFPSYQIRPPSQQVPHRVIQQFGSSPIESRAATISPTRSVSIKVDDLKAQATLLLKSSAEQFMRNQNDIISAMKITLEHLKRVEQNLETRQEILQKELKANQERLQQRFKESMKRAKENAEENKRTCQKHMERLGELNQDNQKKYFETQEDIISQYKKLVKQRNK